LCSKEKKEVLGKRKASSQPQESSMPPTKGSRKEVKEAEVVEEGQPVSAAAVEGEGDKEAKAEVTEVTYRFLFDSDMPTAATTLWCMMKEQLDSDDSDNAILGNVVDWMNQLLTMLRSKGKSGAHDTPDKYFSPLPDTRFNKK
jgi:hypothetical protein